MNFLAHRLNEDKIFDFITAGKSIFTLRSEKTQARHTYRIFKLKDKDIWFVSTMTGTDNENHYSFFGTIFKNLDGSYFFKYSNNKAKVSKDKETVQVFIWFFNQCVLKNSYPKGLEVFHANHCGRCGKLLTVPESVESGIGPYCAGLVN